MLTCQHPAASLAHEVDWAVRELEWLTHALDAELVIWVVAQLPARHSVGGRR